MIESKRGVNSFQDVDLTQKLVFSSFDALKTTKKTTMMSKKSFEINQDTTGLLMVLTIFDISLLVIENNQFKAL
jgi:hypothetical protein